MGAWASAIPSLCRTQILLFTRLPWGRNTTVVSAHWTWRCCHERNFPSFRLTDGEAEGQEGDSSPPEAPGTCREGSSHHDGGMGMNKNSCFSETPSYRERKLIPCCLTLASGLPSGMAGSRSPNDAFKICICQLCSSSKNCQKLHMTWKLSFQQI